MNREQSALWQRIRELTIDDPAASFPLSARLASEQGWTLAYARRVIDEYKRFVFLAMVADHEVTPSRDVDEAWHLHLTYTRSYWDHFCPEVLRRPLHHLPTRGDVDVSRHRDQYAMTLATYRAWFAEEPPNDVWPNRGKPQQLSQPRGGCDDAWVIAKPSFGWLRRARSATASVSLCMVPIVFALVNPLDLVGHEFLVFYAFLAAGAAIVALFLRHHLRGNENFSTTPLSPYQVACLTGGVPGVVQAAIVSLIDRKSVKIGRADTKNKNSKDYRLTNRAGLPDDAEEFEQRIVAASNLADGSNLNFVMRAAEPSAKMVQNQLEAWGLLTPSDRVNTCQWVPFLVMAAVVIVGFLKIIVGMSRDKPVLYLVLLVIAVAVAALFFLRRPLRTRAGDEVLGRIRREHIALSNKASNQQQPLTGNDLVLAASLFGLATVASGELYTMQTAWKYATGPTPASSGGSCGTGGCSSGDGGGGGGGGCGGGGGGCGGCGGGGD